MEPSDNIEKMYEADWTIEPPLPSQGTRRCERDGVLIEEGHSSRINCLDDPEDWDPQAAQDLYMDLGPKVKIL